MRYIKRYTGLFLTVLTAIALFASCVLDKETEVAGGDGEPVTVTLTASTVGTTLGTRAATTGTGDDRDNQFSSLRVMVFHAGSILAYNKAVDLIGEGNPFTIEMTTGIYDFVFIANEDSDPALSLRLANYKGKNIGSIYGESFSSSAFGNSTTIPMTHIIRNVVVTADDAGVGSISVGGTVQSRPWVVEVERAAVRVDLIFRTREQYTVENFSALKIANVPGKVYLFDRNASGSAIYNVTDDSSFEAAVKVASRTIDGGDGDLYAIVDSKEVFTESDEEFTTTPDENGYYYWYKRIILPSSMFTPSGNEDKAIVFTVVVDGRLMNATLGTDELGYTASRNQRYRLVGTVEAGRPIEFTVNVTPWGESVGILLPVKVAGAGTALSDRTYAGAFWRSNQRGERLIRIPVKAAGNWTVQVYEYGEGFSEGDIVFSSSWDGELPTNASDPDALGSYVTDGGISATATTVKVGYENYIFFRIGLNGMWTPRTGKPARYAVALISYTPSNGTTIHQKLFLRQGEGADYVMAPGDRDANGDAFSDIGRPDAKAWSPYNLTAKSWPANDTEYVQIKKRTASGEPFYEPGVSYGSSEPDFAAYPTMAGAMFQWSQKTDNTTWHRRAFNPGLSTYTDLVWNTTDYQIWAWNEELHETCPEGYRRPDIRAENDGVGGNEAWQSFVCTQSEASANSIWGFYADGYFDRLPVEVAEGSKPNTSYPTVVAKGGKNVAYIGRVIFNSSPSSATHYNASLFIPATGYRYDYINGALEGAGNFGYGWSRVESSSNSYYGCFNNVSKSSIRVNSATNKSNAFPVRCVRDENWTPGSSVLTVTTPDYLTTDGSQYTLTVTSDTEWVATVRRGSDAVTSGPADLLAQPLLNPLTGFNILPGLAYGPSNSRIEGSGNATLRLIMVNYNLAYGLVSGTLELVFRSRATGELLATATIPVG